MGKAKYAIHPGYVASAYDGQIHYIDALSLMFLCGLDKKDCVLWDDKKPETYLGRNFDDYVHIHPRYDGSYYIKEERVSKSCPLMQKPCLLEQCDWYSADVKKCVVYTIASYLNDIRQMCGKPVNNKVF